MADGDKASEHDRDACGAPQLPIIPVGPGKDEDSTKKERFMTTQPTSGMPAPNTPKNKRDDAAYFRVLRGITASTLADIRLPISSTNSWRSDAVEQDEPSLEPKPPPSQK